MNKMDVNEAGMNETGKTPNPAVPRTVQVGAGIFTAVIVGLLIWQVLKPSGSSQTLGKLEGDMHSLMFTTDGRVLYGQHGGIQSSSDGGQTWTASPVSTTRPVCILRPWRTR